MNLRPTLLAVTLLCAVPVTAQTQLLRGDVDGIQGTNRFQLDCTNIELVSATVNLQQLHDMSRQQNIDYEMQVRPTSIGGRFALDVLSATPIPEAFGMGNLRFGRSETWEVFAPAGSEVWTFVSVPSLSSYMPLGNAGTWLIGTDSVPFVQGVTDPAGRFQFRFTMPTIPALVGTVFNGQAIVRTNGVFSVTAPDCKEVRNG